jgi:hypothetical protein
MRKPTPALVISFIALFVALGGAGMAATGGSFILGKANTATSTTALSAAIGGKALQVSNTSTAAGATALGLTAAPGHAPFAVNTSTKVANLSADKLDGIDSTGFVQGRGTALANRIGLPAATNTRLLTIPGLGYLQASCPTIDGHIYWVNDTGGNVDAWTDFSNSHFTYSSVAPNDNLTFVSRYSNVYGGTLALGIGNDPNARRTALLHAFVYQSADNMPCTFEVQGTLWTS